MTITSSTFSNVNVGAAPNDGTGDPLRTSFTKINENFQYITDTIWPNIQVNSLSTDVVSTYISQFNLIQAQTIESGITYSNVNARLIVANTTNQISSDISGAIGNVTHDLVLGSVFNHSSISGNFRVNLINLTINDNETTKVTILLSQSSTPYLANAVQINGSDVNVKWKDGSIPTPIANRYEMIDFILIKISGSYTVTGQLTSFA
jgi:hypothetical protein